MTALKSKEDSLLEIFSGINSPEGRYQKIISLGAQLPPFPIESKVEMNLVIGCQSKMYLQTDFNNGNLTFNAESEALISKGLASLLILLYSGERAEIILKNPPLILEKLGIYASLSPSRSNGLNSLYLKMKQDAIKSLL